MISDNYIDVIIDISCMISKNYDLILLVYTARYYSRTYICKLIRCI